MGHVGLSSAHNSLSYHGVSTGGDEVSGLNGFARHSTNGSSLGGAVAAASSVNGNNTTSAAPRNFHFDYVFGPDSKQTSVYDTAIAPLLSRFVEGYNVTVLAYGQTSSGKTFTMGTEAEDTSLLSHADTVSESTGIVPRALGWLFLWASQQQSGPGIDIRVSFIEVHNEELIDLVSRKKYQGISPPIFIREDTKGNILWNGAEEIPVADTRGALSLLVSGSQQRRTGSTNMNEKSSRSHAIYRITLTQTKTRTRSSSVAADGSADSIKEQVKVVSKLHFVDLAGSERLKRTKATAERQREGISINSGLLALGNVISALGDPQRSSHSFVPYRDSKLTHMLRDSLGGSAQTLLIACVSAAESNLHETINTLKYAARARNIK
ncbi:P-loop containing nucleoside triphosphate hydrolase protein, partial [Coemansia spiralis]